MLQYNAARLYALKGDADNCVKYLGQLKAMGRAQRDRLAQTQKDESFKKVQDDPQFKAIFE